MLTIGQVALTAGLRPSAIRYYEAQGLIAPAGRADNSYRLYSDADLHQLRFIRLCRAMDMSLDEGRTLLALDLSRRPHRSRPCATGPATAACALRPATCPWRGTCG